MKRIVLLVCLLMAVSCSMASPTTPTSTSTPTPIPTPCLSIEPELQFVGVDFEIGSEYSYYYRSVQLYFDPPQLFVVPTENSSGGIFSLSHDKAQWAREQILDYLNSLTVAESNDQPIHTPLCMLTIGGYYQLQFITPSLVLTNGGFGIPLKENKPFPCQILGEMANEVITSTTSR